MMTSQKIGCVQASPVIFNKQKTVEKAAKFIKKAADEDVNFLVFPESFIPAYPAGMGFGTVVGSRTDAGREQFREYWEQSVDVPGPETQTLTALSKKHGIYITMGVTERDAVSKTLYCSLLYFSPVSGLMGKHRKLKPTAAERLVWGDGDSSTLTTFDTDIGIIGGLICWENYMPLARMAMYQKGVELYVAPTADARDSWTSTMIHIAREGRCYVIGCNQIIRKSDYPDHLRKELADDSPELLSRGGSVIVSPMGEILAGPLYGEEGILTAIADRNELIRSKMDFDVIGHYSRNDVFKYGVPGQPDIQSDKKS